MVTVRGGDYAAPSGLDTNQALRHIPKPCCDPASRDLLVQNNRPIVTQTDQMQRVLACVDTNGACNDSNCLPGGWAAMTKRYRGRQWHCRTIRTINLDYVWPPQATQWPDGRSNHTRQWLGCGNSIPRYVFPLSKTCWALIGVLKTSRDWKKDCGKPDCRNKQRLRSGFRPIGASGIYMHTSLRF